MKIGLIIYGSLDLMSGGYLYDRKLVESLRKRGDEVRIISLPQRNYPAYLLDNFSFRLPAGFDLIIEDELNHPSLLAANAGHHPCPVVSLVHNLHALEPRPVWKNNLYRIAERVYLNSVDGFIFNSKTTQNAVQSLIDDKKPFLVANPPTDRFGSPVDENRIRLWTKSPGLLRLLFLGTVIPLKGLHVVLEAIRGQPSMFSLDVVGSLTVDAPYAEKMKQFVVANDLETHVCFHGVLDNGPLIEKLENAQAMVIPSAYEGFGISYLEGMGFGLPAIATTSGAASEFIIDGENGFLIPPENSSILLERLTLLCRDRKLLEQMSVNALRSYRQRPSWEQSGEHIRDFLLHMIQSKP